MKRTKLYYQIVAEKQMRTSISSYISYYTKLPNEQFIEVI